MQHTEFKEDSQPLSAFGAKTASLLGQMRRTGRPLFLTKHGQAEAVVLDAAAYEQLIEELETLRDIRTATEQVAAGRGITHHAAKRKIREGLRA
ncbi:MAG: type II toxin-antitoxin system Phd/YefM family antitoxin [Candidatus Hydrogenedentes bacterium]|nr:type II toxin-antitoxin system Phd/YefM family antitoxin [Candidatus Hydrogenedentota bacterium]